MSHPGLDLGVMSCRVTSRAGTLDTFRGWFLWGTGGKEMFPPMPCPPSLSCSRKSESRLPRGQLTLPKGPLRTGKTQRPGPSIDPFLPYSQFSCPLPPPGLDEPEGWGSHLARPNFAGWEFFRVLIKRSHPERMTSLVHTHTLLPCPLLCPHSHAQPRQGRWVEGARQGKIGL